MNTKGEEIWSVSERFLGTGGSECVYEASDGR